METLSRRRAEAIPEMAPSRTLFLISLMRVEREELIHNWPQRGLIANHET